MNNTRTTASELSVAKFTVDGERVEINFTDAKVHFADLFVCVEVLLPSQPNGVMSSVVSLPNHTLTGQV